MRVAIYALVSTKDKGRKLKNQLRQLRAYCHKQKWIVHHIYVDRKSGASNNREELKMLCEDAHQRKFDLGCSGPWTGSSGKVCSKPSSTCRS